MAPRWVARGLASVPQVVRGNRNFRRVAAADLTSSLGATMSTLAFPLLVLSLGGSAVQAGSIATVSLATRLGFRLPAGHLVDQWNPRTVMIVSDLVRLAALASIPASVIWGGPHYPHLLAVALVEGVAAALFGPAVNVLIRDVVTPSQLPEALGLSQSVMALTNLVGPAAGGALFAVDPMLPFALDAASYGISALLLRRVAVRRSAPAEAAERGGLTAGIRWLLSERSLLSVLVFASVINLVSATLEVLVILDLRSQGLSGGHIGLILSCIGVSAVVGSLLAPVLCRRMSIPAILLGMGVAWTVVLATFGLHSSPWLVAVSLFALMLLSPTAGVVVGHALLSRTPRPLVGRVTATTSVLMMGLSALGPISAGALHEVFGAARGWLILALAMAVLTAASWVPLQSTRALASIPDREPDPPSDVEPDVDWVVPDRLPEDAYDVVAHWQWPGTNDWRPRGR
ncbi:MFS transporter [Phytohabitans sp. ZYX-F-186]|uniref:MFS transporter n=1 Tax=Phytohabitans maris TaxID=3071409 RepID=A0ABU0ZWA9_9ACTN|nr:MFS transporter [Phytohabitans sp. ZYX-F-186]MDQ7911324.1 MFS transporter [Phytohabitans sp. ZYX-F-186]